MSLTKEDYLKGIESMTVVELNDLIEAIKEKFGVSGAPVMAAAGEGADQGEGSAEEKSAFNVVLRSAGGSKIAVIKAVKAITGLGLKESKEFVDNPGKALKENVDKAQAEEMKKKLEEVGAEVELQ